ncbi:SET domain-containing protein [Clathrospora elynae]|uniref:SET domain-containing protein n=1 Tax=Clathrospora elynae TaxID=706981 RepID=A0A6A5SPU5_9PLEO|nr:SET domain-containing protein [Clathrospora elynae]
MKTVTSFSLFGGALALSNQKVDIVAQQQPLLQNACPSNSILHNGECQLSTYDTSSTITLGYQSNISHITQTLEDSRETASRIKDFPWNFSPECFSTEATEEPYCVFSDQNFASGRGIFIITTKTLAYAMLEKDAFTRPETLSRMNHFENPPFYKHDFPGKGRGLVANKTLQRGDQLFASTPILITDPDLYDLPNSERLALMHRGIETLPVASQRVFWELMGHTDDDPIDDRINTNNFEIAIDGVSQSALFPEIAMLNHDCRPNAAYFFDEETLTHYIHAIKPIYPGEEITITYTNNEEERSERMRRLEKNWGFKCACSTCTAHPHLVEESDARLKHIAALQKVLDDWTPASSATPAVAELLISLMQQERLEASLSIGYKHAAEVYSSFGMKWEAVKYAKLSVELSMLDKGWTDRDVWEMKKMGENPEMSWSWQKRVGLVAKSAGCGCGGRH